MSYRQTHRHRVRQVAVAVTLAAAGWFVGAAIVLSHFAEVAVPGPERSR